MRRTLISRRFLNLKLINRCRKVVRDVDIPVERAKSYAGI